MLARWMDLKRGQFSNLKKTLLFPFPASGDECLLPAILSISAKGMVSLICISKLYGPLRAINVLLRNVVQLRECERLGQESLESAD